ncbi:hypothetical protein L596_007556 [Steinernema carpocapsae]|uniref:Uncharacterized protein n=1 Tax=Steinernema carpocapsae TaxID=34508 RepID=A0A4U5PAB6_STECR|nr:hypothetical protein L596_007556 [Steinernema carpocapsae]
MKHRWSPSSTSSSREVGGVTQIDVDADRRRVLPPPQPPTIHEEHLFHRSFWYDLPLFQRFPRHYYLIAPRSRCLLRASFFGRNSAFAFPFECRLCRPYHLPGERLALKAVYGAPEKMTLVCLTFDLRDHTRFGVFWGSEKGNFDSGRTVAA